jgi:LysR family nitrogen assimilation transcriptional regulator
MSHFGSDAFAKPVLIEPPMRMTCSLVHSGGLPLTNAGQALLDFLIGFIEHRVQQPDMPGTEWIAKN